MDIKRSNGFKNFSKKIGQNNHFLITILIGLDAVKEGIAKKEDGFKTSWNPKSVEDSALRSREFAIKATLAWLVDCLDSYFMYTYTKPKLIQENNFESAYCSANQSVYKRYTVFKEWIYDLPDIESALVDLTISWRNRLIHSNANNPISEKSREILIANMDTISDNYQGLIIVETLEAFSNKNAPKFKEITAMIRACRTFVQELDRNLITRLDKKRFTNELISYYVNEVINQKVNTLWGKDEETRKRQLRNFLKNFSFVDSKEENELDEYIEEIANKGEQEIKEMFIHKEDLSEANFL